MARTFTDNFVTGDFSLWDLTSGTIAISTLQAKVGTNSARSNRTSSTTGFLRKHLFASDQNAVQYARAYIYIVSAPSANNVQVLRFSSLANAHLASIRLDTDLTLGLFQANNTIRGSRTAALSLNTWYKIELKIDSTAATGTIEGRLEGSSFASGNNSSRGSWARLLVGAITPNTTSDQYFDAIAVDDATWPADEPAPGSGPIFVKQAGTLVTHNAKIKSGGVVVPVVLTIAP